jgi:diketogulonate reductase-like aldo/keto reductase
MGINMETRQLGQSDIQITPILMGMWQAGKEMWVDIDDKQTTQAVRAAFDSGITTFDTAEAYGKGHSEKILASAKGTKAAKDKGKRALFLGDLRGASTDTRVRPERCFYPLLNLLC